MIRDKRGWPLKAAFCLVMILILLFMDSLSLATIVTSKQLFSQYLKDNL